MSEASDQRLDETGPLEGVQPDARPPTTGGLDAAEGKDDARLPDLGSIVGNYRLLEIIGTGGMGRVYAAEHTLLGKKVALKMLRHRYAKNPEAVERFFSEARAVTRIDHPNLVDVTDFIDAPEWPPCFVMSFLKGKSLARVIREDGPFEVSRLLTVAVQTASAVAAVHDASIIHRDLKPANIFLVERRAGFEQVKLLDFGVAKLLDESGLSMHDTNSSVPVGTPDYMAPEAVTGSARVDHRVDVWSLGAVLYEAATGALPYKAATFGELVFALLSRDVAPPNKLREGREPLPAPLELLILQCLNRVMAQRPSTMHEVHERLVAMAQPYQLPVLEGSGFAFVETDPGVAAFEQPPPSSAVARPDEGGADPATPVSAQPEALSPSPPGISRVVLMAAAGIALTALVTLVSFSLAGAPDDDAQANAESAAQASAQAAVAKREVVIHFESTPEGAVVTRAGEPAPLGKTPFELVVARENEPISFDIALPGYTTATTTLVPSKARHVHSTLAPLPPAPVVDPPAPVAPPPPPAEGKRSTPKKEQKPADKEGLLPVF